MATNPKLIVLSEKLRGKSFDLDKELVTVGRTDKSDICIKDATISTGHCDFTRNGDVFILNDRGSTNGTRINNVPVPDGGQELKNSDILQFGAVEIFFDSNDGTATSITRTHTGIDLDSTEVGLSTVKNLGNFSPYEKGGKGGMSQKVMLSLVLLLIIAIVVLIAYAVFAMYSGTPEEGQAKEKAKWENSQQATPDEGAESEKTVADTVTPTTVAPKKETVAPKKETVTPTTVAPKKETVIPTTVAPKKETVTPTTVAPKKETVIPTTVAPTKEKKADE